jgi:hypothetical protein
MQQHMSLGGFHVLHPLSDLHVTVTGLSEPIYRPYRNDLDLGNDVDKFTQHFCCTCSRQEVAHRVR